MAFELKRLAGRLFAELGRAKLSTHQAVIFERLVKVTLVQGRQSVRLPRLDLFDRFKIPKAKVSMALHGFWSPNEQAPDRKWIPGMIEMGLLQLRKHADGGFEIVVMPDATQWRCEWRFTKADDEWFLREVNAVAGQVQTELLPREPDLSDALAEVSAENASSQIGNRSAGQIPKLGTPLRTPFNVLNVQSSKPDKAFNIERSTEEKLMTRCLELFGAEIMATYGANWRLRARENPSKLCRVLDDTAAAIREGRVKRIPAAYANDAWSRFQ